MVHVKDKPSSARGREGSDTTLAGMARVSPGRGLTLSQAWYYVHHGGDASDDGRRVAEAPAAPEQPLHPG
jgi:hypothetical protein